jgi:hypothetical protein
MSDTILMSVLSRLSLYRLSGFCRAQRDVPCDSLEIGFVAAAQPPLSEVLVGLAELGAQ